MKKLRTYLTTQNTASSQNYAQKNPTNDNFVGGFVYVTQYYLRVLKSTFKPQ